MMCILCFLNNMTGKERSCYDIRVVTGNESGYTISYQKQVKNYIVAPYCNIHWFHMGSLQVAFILCYFSYI
jgi:hypothetical protein